MTQNDIGTVDNKNKGIYEKIKEYNIEKLFYRF